MLLDKSFGCSENAVGPRYTRWLFLLRRYRHTFVHIWLILLPTLGLLAISSVVLVKLLDKRIHCTLPDGISSFIHPQGHLISRDTILFRSEDHRNHEARYPLEPEIPYKKAVTGEKEAIRSDPLVLLFVPSRPGNAQDRAAVRETWGTHARQRNFRVIFGFGHFDDVQLFRRLQVEQEMYGDLLQTADIIDAYHNQTRLVLAFFEWGEASSGNLQFIGRADEDAWINIFEISKYLKLPEAAQNAVIGNFLMNAAVHRLIKEKWYLTKEEYVEDTLPPFAFGQLYIFPVFSMRAVLTASTRITIHWLDDVFIAGQIPSLLNMTLVKVTGRAELKQVEHQPCFAHTNTIIHGISAEKKRVIFYDPRMSMHLRRS